jgi:hypothetical protein
MAVRKIKRVLAPLAALFAAALFFFYLFSQGCFSPGKIAGNTRYPDMALRAEQALKYAERRGMNNQYCLFLDYGIPSGKPRLFVWSFEEGRIVYSGYAMHGPGKGSTDEVPVFSNVYGSLCSSVGRYEVTRNRGTRNKTGLRLKGLDLSNNNAYFRGIMIHSSRWVDRNKWRKYIPLNEKCCQGCVTVSTRDMAYINRLVGQEEGNLLLWAFYDA